MDFHLQNKVSPTFYFLCFSEFIGPLIIPKQYFFIFIFCFYKEEAKKESRNTIRNIVLTNDTVSKGINYFYFPVDNDPKSEFR